MGHLIIPIASMIFTTNFTHKIMKKSSYLLFVVLILFACTKKQNVNNVDVMAFSSLKKSPGNKQTVFLTHYHFVVY